MQFCELGTRFYIHLVQRMDSSKEVACTYKNVTDFLEHIYVVFLSTFRYITLCITYMSIFCLPSESGEMCVAYIKCNKGYWVIWSSLLLTICLLFNNTYIKCNQKTQAVVTTKTNSQCSINSKKQKTGIPEAISSWRGIEVRITKPKVNNPVIWMFVLHRGEAEETTYNNYLEASACL